VLVYVANKKKKQKKIPFPTTQQYPCCRLGAQLIYIGDYIICVDEKIVQVQNITLCRGELVLNYTISISQVMGRFDACFSGNRMTIYDQKEWNF
jgi:hypothetical protein